MPISARSTVDIRCSLTQRQQFCGRFFRHNFLVFQAITEAKAGRHKDTAGQNAQTVGCSDRVIVARMAWEPGFTNPQDNFKQFLFMLFYTCQCLSLSTFTITRYTIRPLTTDLLQTVKYILIPSSLVESLRPLIIYKNFELLLLV